ncbi:hypothetical protein AMIS_63750 [Actinoplanes missouriensis 431]|uniref:Uncharacterized protein n=1 Tax=Actinoplanes missouriensis (strain ATCC 14538 / DSM 43046 / CBS 188.64 / JCM 3121 / NBRC 102363 / NCIMB 12654 / NRRL B-3342 / UNCC 431) TaxID=512565 RepID=I0HF08_ACTM4|nr:hypothetical protein [Actinoplanes missouriensis]BAL91595.1 hypothetical protein AMIS_63750 [Actinoplanes missouriensis 431]
MATEEKNVEAEPAEAVPAAEAAPAATVEDAEAETGGAAAEPAEAEPAEAENAEVETAEAETTEAAAIDEEVAEPAATDVDVAEEPAAEGASEPQPVDAPAPAVDSDDAESTQDIVPESLSAAPAEEPQNEPAEGLDPQLVTLSVVVGLLAIAVVVVFGMIVFDPVALISFVPDWFAEPGSSRIIGSVTAIVIMSALAIAMRQIFLRRRG